MSVEISSEHPVQVETEESREISSQWILVFEAQFTGCGRRRENSETFHYYM